MVYKWFILAAIYLVLVHIVAKYIGEKRKIGYGKTILWSILFSPLIGLIIALTSARIEKT